jgi:hypothetical protein
VGVAQQYVYSIVYCVFVANLFTESLPSDYSTRQNNMIIRSENENRPESNEGSFTVKQAAYIYSAANFMSECN